MIYRKDFSKIFYPGSERRVKLLYGVRRAGKTSLFRSYEEQLIQNGAPKQNFVTVSCDTGYETYRDHVELHSAVCAAAKGADREYGKIHILINEPLSIHEWALAVLHLARNSSEDLYGLVPDITVCVSHADGVSIPNTAVLDEFCDKHLILPLSFREVFAHNRTLSDEPPDPAREFADYITRGGFPLMWRFPADKDEAHTYAADVLSAALWSDAPLSGQVRRYELLKGVLWHLNTNLGHSITANQSFLALKDRKFDLTLETVYAYLDRLTQAYIVFCAKRYDLLADTPLKTSDRYFFSDIAFRSAAKTVSDGELASVIENVFYLELLARGYNVFFGKLNKDTVDFVCFSGDERVYYCFDDTLKAGARPLQLYSRLKDAYPKLVVTGDRSRVGVTEDGVEVVHLFDVLLDG
ncbi:MAG: AAA family ATPase [Oscillospiraceae bacterium]|nr:AAA family ATPase [Oscillospiraceae bacterium]